MNENMKDNETAYMYFHKVYIYVTNTKTKFSQLTEKEKKKKNFQWYSIKHFLLAKNKVKTMDEVLDVINKDPDLREEQSGVNDRGVKTDDKQWKHKSYDYVIYGCQPLTVYDVKLLLNIFGIRLFRFFVN